MSYSLSYKFFGSNAILIEWPETIQEDILDDIIGYKKEIQKRFDNSIVELIPAYNSLTVIKYDESLALNQLKKTLISIYEKVKIPEKKVQRLWKIPVCYDETFGIDQELLCKQKKITRKKLIELHTASIYTLYCIGFLPGFMYLGGLPEILKSSRKDTPRLRVEKGSVGIGGNQTGIYPQNSPGGWNIIGNSPINLFDVTKEEPCFVKVGDKVQFQSISLPAYNLMKIEVETGIFSIENEWVK